jgi:uncharacterized repeat protein (TIGR04076 family)
MKPVRITVLKTMTIKDVFGDKVPVRPAGSFWEGPCPRLKVGDEFIVDEKGSCPEGFCGWAFADIHPVITHFRYGGTFGQCEGKDVAIACCTDGLRPAFFKVEAVE